MSADPHAKEHLRALRSISLVSQGSFELDATKLLQLLSADDIGSDEPDVKITRKSLSKIRGDLNLSEQELDIIFSALDVNGDGVITSSELRHRVENGSVELGPMVFEENPGEIEGLAELSDELSLLEPKCQEQVCELYQQLHQVGHPDLLETYEAVVLGVLKDIRLNQVENERLEKTFKREKDQHERHLRQMEEEMEVQVQRVEERAKRREQEKTENEKAEMRDKVQEEITMLQQNLKRMQQEGPEAKNKEIEDQLLHLKGKVEEMTFANRQLKSELTDTQTNLALIKSDFTSMGQQHDEKCYELGMEKETVTEYIREQENLTRQLHLLHDANKRLHDTNDDLREAIETSRRASPLRQQSVVSSAGSSVRTHPGLERKGSLMSEYFQSAPAWQQSSLQHDQLTRIRSRMNSTTSLVEEPPHQSVHVHNVHNIPQNSPRLIRVKTLRKDSCESDCGHVEDIDSGHSTLRDPNENDFDNDAFLNDADTLHEALEVKRLRRTRSHHQPFVEDMDSHDELETESEAPMEPIDPRLYRTVSEQRRIGSGSRSSSSRSSKSRDGRDVAVSRGVRRQNTTTQEPTVNVSKEPERMFKVVLAGDAAVGKSSLIMRLCKGKFVSNLSSTLGVDFQTKMIELDGRTVALQLWDTAGQERFRSIAKSYFRRADGVLLLYDCTYERSFLSIRDWMESIESSQESSVKRLPIMLCGNKTDMRQEAVADGRTVVSYDEGHLLAREFEALFIETSAKEGSNIMESVTELTRLMRANEDLEVKTAGLQLHEKPKETNGSCCGK